MARMLPRFISTLVKVAIASLNVGTILDIDEKQDSGFFIAQASDFVFTGGERLAGGDERKRDLD